MTPPEQTARARRRPRGPGKPARRRRLRGPATLAGRVTLVVTVAVAVVLAVVGTALVTEVASHERAATDRDLRSAAARLSRPARRAIVLPALARRPESPLARPGGTIAVRVLDGRKVVFDDGRAFGVPVPATDGLATVQGRWRVLVRTVRASGPGRLVVAEPLAPVDRRIADLRREVALAALAGLVACALAVWLLAARALRPLGRLRASAAGVSTTRDLTVRLEDAVGPEEVDDVARSLNAMLARLEASADATERALEAARRFTADAGHELRTPLTSLRANLSVLEHDALPDDERARVFAEVKADQLRLVALLDSLQALARGDAGAAPAHAPVDLAELVDGALAGAGRRHPEVAFEWGDSPNGAGALVDGDEAGLRAAVDNLLENAARHGARRVRVSVDGARVVVDDDGPGIPAAERERVFERFARGRATGAAGSGLGLAVVAQQAALHGGRAWAEASPLGGARLVLALGDGHNGAAPRHVGA